MGEPAVRRGPGRTAGIGDSRQALLGAGRDVFSRQGYAGASVREILANAETTAPTLYHHFGNKAGLYLAVVDEVNDQIVAAFESAIEGRETLVDRLDGLLDVTLLFQARDSAFANLVAAAPVEIRRYPELEGGLHSARRMRDFIDRMCSTSVGLTVPAPIATRAVITLFYGLARSAVTLGPAQFAAVVDANRFMARHGFGA
ncbi:MAG: TetR/AcrR family transcriptional regulator [Pseudolysinimonas sp.]